MLPELQISMQHGAAITSMRALGREWLVQGDHPDGSQPSYTHTPPRGWDELAPTIEAGDSPLGPLPDHGDAWRYPWTATPRGMRFTSDFGYALEREIAVQPNRVDLHYALSSDIDHVPVLWAAHPLFRAEDTTQLQLPGYDGLVLDKWADQWIPLADAVSCVGELSDGESRKYVLPAESAVHEALLVHPNGDTLHMSWDCEQLPYLAIYIERCAYSQEPVIAIEPMTGWYDALSRAEANERVTLVHSQQPKSWTIRLDFSR